MRYHLLIFCSQKKICDIYGDCYIAEAMVHKKNKDNILAINLSLYIYQIEIKKN